MNTENVDCAAKATAEEVKVPGDFHVYGIEGDRAWMVVMLPGEKHAECIPLNRKGPTGERTWGWDGNLEKPTLQPSIHYVGHWHGYMTSGRLKSC